MELLMKIQYIQNLPVNINSSKQINFGNKYKPLSTKIVEIPTEDALISYMQDSDYLETFKNALPKITQLAKKYKCRFEFSIPSKSDNCDLETKYLKYCIIRDQNCEIPSYVKDSTNIYPLNFLFDRYYNRVPLQKATSNLIREISRHLLGAKRGQ